MPHFHSSTVLKRRKKQESRVIARRTRDAAGVFCFGLKFADIHHKYGFNKLFSVITNQ